ncbi:MAG: PP2C family protein-serine/threonine phosphatase [Vicinamibacterales bacterium]
MIRVVLVDDEAPARARLRALLDEVGGVTVVAEAADADTARAAVATHAPDVAFLDIEMPVERGTDLAASLPEPRPLVVFATAYERFAIDAFQYDAADYLLKPVTRERLRATLDRLRAKLDARRAVDREWHDASRAQAHLLPRVLPDVPGYAIGAGTLPARAVGGDFYDVRRAGDRVALVLGDVAGKGMAAGLIASSVQARWESAVGRDVRDLDALVGSLNRDVLASTEGSRYATLIHAVLDPSTGRVDYVNAGHPAALVVDADGREVARLEPTAPAVGLMEVGRFPVHVHTLAPGDTLVVVSDGVTEARDAAGDEWDLSAIPDLVARYRHGAPALAAAIIDAVRRHRGADQGQDDVTVCILGRLP